MTSIAAGPLSPESQGDVRANFSKVHVNAVFLSRAAKRGGVQTGGFPDLDLSFLCCPFLSFLGLSRFFWDFPDLLGMVQGFSPFVPFLFLGLLRAPTRNSPERVRDTIWTFPEKRCETPGLDTPGLALNFGIFWIGGWVFGPLML